MTIHTMWVMASWLMVQSIALHYIKIINCSSKNSNLFGSYGIQGGCFLTGKNIDSLV